MKSNWKSAVFSVKKSKTFKIMRLLMIFCFFFVSGAMANGYSQEQVVSLRKYGNRLGYASFIMKNT